MLESLGQSGQAWYTFLHWGNHTTMGKPVLRMTSRIPIIAAIVLVVLQIFSPAPPIMFSLVVIAGVLGLSYFWARQLATGVVLHRQRRYGWAQVGDIIEERFTMHNDGWVPLLWCQIRDMGDLPGYDASRALGLGARATTRWTTEGVCERRGVYTLGPVLISMGDPFGLFNVTLAHEYSEGFVVYPPIAAIPSIVEPRGMIRGSARANERSLEMTTDASSVRQYAPGDALKSIHWRSTARRSGLGVEQLYVKEFDLEPGGDLWIILDMDENVNAGEDLESTEEYGVTLAASLANNMLRANHAVGLITYADEPIVIPPQKGHQQLWELLRVLAGTHATSNVPMAELLNLFEPVLGRGMSAAIITPSCEAGWIKNLSLLLRHGIHPTGILLDASTFGGDGDVRAVRAALADLGVMSHTIGSSYRFTHITQKRQQRPTYKVLGTGRVVVAHEGEDSQWVTVGEGGD